MSEEIAQTSLLLAVRQRWEAMWTVSKIAADLGVSGESVANMVRVLAPAEVEAKA